MARFEVRKVTGDGRQGGPPPCVQREPWPQSVAAGRPCSLSTASRASGHPTPLLCLPGRNGCRGSGSPGAWGSAPTAGLRVLFPLVCSVPTTDWGKATQACAVPRVVGTLVHPRTFHPHARALSCEERPMAHGIPWPGLHRGHVLCCWVLE